MSNTPSMVPGPELSTSVNVSDTGYFSILMAKKHICFLFCCVEYTDSSYVFGIYGAHTDFMMTTATKGSWFCRND